MNNIIFSKQNCQVLACEIRHPRQMKAQITEEPSPRSVSAASFHNYIISTRNPYAANRVRFFHSKYCVTFRRTSFAVRF